MSIENQEGDSTYEHLDSRETDGYLIYELGLPIGQKLTDEYSSRDDLKGPIQFMAKEAMQRLVNPEKKISPEQRQEILDKALPIFHTKNLLFHITKEERVPIIAHTGILSRAVIDRHIKSKYGGETIRTSGWGAPFVGNRYIDVFDPTFALQEAEVTHGFPIPVKVHDGYADEFRFERKVDAKDTLDYSVDQEFDAKNEPQLSHQLQNRQQIQMLVIRLDNEGTKNRLIRWESSEYELLLGSGEKGKDYSDPETRKKYWRDENKWMYVKSHVKPDELVGLIDGQGIARKVLAAVAKSKGEQPSEISDEEDLEILGNNIEMPIYDRDGNLVWPAKVSADDLLKKALAEQEKKKAK